MCLDCGKQFEYDLKEMRIGKAIDHSHNAGVVPPNLPKPRADRWKYVALAAVPVAAVLAAMVKTKKSGPQGSARKWDEQTDGPVAPAERGPGEQEK